MLVELKIENFGIIEHLRMRLGPGLNVITGETGAGKSLILQAIDVLTGSRAGPGLVRTGSHRAVLEALFDIRAHEAARRWLEENGYPLEDTYVTLHRELSLDGKSRTSINGISSRLSLMRALSSQLIEIHGQHEHQRILDADAHLDSLDLFAGTISLRDNVGRLYGRYIAINKRLRSRALETGEREMRLDFLKFALQEIEAFEPLENEYEELCNEKALIRNSGRMYADYNEAYYEIREGEHSVLDLLTRLENLLEEYTDLDPDLERELSELREARYRAESVADFLRDKKEALQFSPERMEEVEERIVGYQRLHKKYGGSAEAVLRKQNDFLRELSAIELGDEESELLRSEREVVYSELRELAEELSLKRRSVIPRLEDKLKGELETLGMPGAAICVSVRRELAQEKSLETEQALTSEDDMRGQLSHGSRADRRARYLINEKGLDRVEFLLRANEGEALLPLRKIASGGELSRITLSLKSILMEQKPVCVVVFDEIDAGVGGEVAHSIADRLKTHALNNQTLVVTHLHQVAGLADQHFFISKQSQNGRTISSIQRLQGDKRLYELARMLGGAAPGSAVLEHARELLARAAG